MNHFSLELLPSNTLLCSTSSETTSVTESRSDTSSSPGRDCMFKKLLTPSDVGKLNRLVIPKQNAEKYFPPAGNGIFLEFEDNSGKSWRFKYSYWNSSQSYVFTKGWTRYVKDNKLLAGDFVLFYRNPFQPARFFIGSRPRGVPPTPVFSLAEIEIRQQILMSQKAVRSQVNPKRLRLRLFGVTLECELEDTEPQTSDNSTLSSQGLGSGSIQNSGPNPH